MRAQTAVERASMKRLRLVVVMPWKDEALATLHPPAGSDELPRIIFSGTLFGVALDLATWEVTALANVRVALPDRARSPFSFHGMALLRLIAAAREETRPGFNDEA